MEIRSFLLHIAQVQCTRVTQSGIINIRTYIQQNLGVYVILRLCGAYKQSQDCVCILCTHACTAVLCQAEVKCIQLAVQGGSTFVTLWLQLT